MKTSILLLAALLGTSVVYAQSSSKKSYHRTESHTNDDNTSITTDWKGARYELELVKDKLTELSVDGKEIPQAEWSKYDAAIKDIMLQLKKDREQAAKDRMQAEKDRAQADKDRAQADRDREQAGKDRAQGELDREQAAKDRIQAEKDRAQAGQDRIQAEKDRAHAAEDKKQMQAMISEMVSDKIIASESGLKDLRITDDEMLVNGKKQDDEVFKKYKAKYSRFTGSNVIINRNGSRVYTGN
jgi:hypothetical protein